MASGQWFVRELRSSDTPDELRSRALTRLTPELERANYELVASTDRMLRYRRRRPPSGAIFAGALLIAVAACAVAVDIPAGRAVALPMAAVSVCGIALLALVRRSDVLIVTVSSRPAGSSALVAGYVNDRARIALRTWNPPVRPKLHCVTHAPHRAAYAGRPAIRSAPSRER
jgi:hypothetical protein